MWAWEKFSSTRVCIQWTLNGKACSQECQQRSLAEMLVAWLGSSQFLAFLLEFFHLRLDSEGALQTGNSCRVWRLGGLGREERLRHACGSTKIWKRLLEVRDLVSHSSLASPLEAKEGGGETEQGEGTHHDWMQQRSGLSLEQTPIRACGERGGGCDGPERSRDGWHLGRIELLRLLDICDALILLLCSKELGSNNAIALARCHGAEFVVGRWCGECLSCGKQRRDEDGDSHGDSRTWNW
mmetsp:Transcript_20989/g.58404  ORF Transcript_20989/g.58404 Transcript_20989/m.58404 type:complete len:240 (+) Transcript_20989:324-1043(+)